MIRALVCTLIAWLLLAVSSFSVARACTCLPPGLGVAVMPADGMYAPRNTRIWVAHGAVSTPEAGLDVVLLDGNGVVVPTDRSDIASGTARWLGIVVLTPRALLPAGAAFTVAYRDANDTENAVHFSTNELVDLERPGVPRVLDADVDPGGGSEEEESCDVGTASLSLRLSTDTWLLKRDAASADDPSFDPEHMSGLLEDFTAASDGGGGFSYGRLCDVSPWQGLPAEMQFATLDLAGNFSGWSDTQRFALKPTAADACSVARPGTEPPIRAGAAAWLAAAVLLVRRRARRRDI